MTKLNIPDQKMTPAIEGGAIEKAVKDAGGTSTKMYRVPLGKIAVIPGFNVRVDSEDYIAHRDAIAESISANGYDETKPLSGYVGKDEAGGNIIYVTDGHTRLDAVLNYNADPDTKKADEISALPVVVRRDTPSMADLTVALHTSNSGRPLTPYELGVVVNRLLTEEGAEKDAIAHRLAVTPRYLEDVILLAEAPVKVRNYVLSGDISSTMAIQELRRDPAAAAERISGAVAKAKSGGKKRATAKDVGPKLRRETQVIEFTKGTNIKALVVEIAAKVRDAIAVEGEGDDRITTGAGEVKLVIGVEVEPKAKKKPAAKKKAAPAKKKPAASAPAEPENDLGIEGVEDLDEEPVTRVDEDLDLPAPPAIKSDAGGNGDDI